jgi:hypothetical protein
MKKLFLLALTGICCLALAIPAMGAVKMSGMITMDWNYVDMDSARAANRSGTAPLGVAPGQLVFDNGFEDMSFDFPMPLTFLQASYVSKDKVVSGVLRLRVGGVNAGTTPINLYLANMTYRFSEKFSMTFGRQNTILAPMSPSQLSGFAQWGHIVGIGWGNQNHTSTRDGITAEFVLSPMVRLQLGIFDNDTDNVEDPQAHQPNANNYPANSIIPTTREENDLPRFDVALPINWNWLTIVPSFTWLTQEYDQTPPGNQNDIDIWAGALSARATFGPFSIEGEICFGENLGSGNYSGGSILNSGQTAYQLGGIATNPWLIADTDDLAWYIALSWKFGPATLHGMYGQLNSESEGDPTMGSGGNNPDQAEFDVTRQFYGLACPISIGGGFTIRPELFFYDYDDDALWQGNPDRNMGEEMILSVLFMLNF